MEVPRGMEPTGTNGRTRHTLSDPLVGDWVSSCGGFLVGWQGTLFLVVTTMLVRRLICLRPLSGSRTATTGIGRVAGSVAGRSVWSAVQSGFAVVMAQVRRPVPFRTRKLRPGTAMVLHSRGCGRVARRRIQRWGFPSSVTLREPPFLFVVPARRPKHVARGSRRAFPVPGRLGLFRASKGNYCYSTKTSGEQIFFRNVLLTRYMIRFSEYGLWNGIGKDGNDVPEHRSAACTM